VSPAVTNAAPAVDDAQHACPTLGAVVRRVSLSLLVACLIPAVLFYTTFVLAGVWTAILVALCWSYGAMIFRAATGRRTSGLLIITATLITLRTVVSLAAGSTFLYFLQPIISDMVVGTTFLLSLATARPLVARLAGDFYPMTEELRLRPRVQRLFRNLTVMWAALCIGKASFTLWLLQSQSLEDFVLIKSVTVLAVNMFAAAATIAVAALCARREGLLGPRAQLVPIV
jgi:intracellular septation protein A